MNTRKPGNLPICARQRNPSRKRMGISQSHSDLLALLPFAEARLFFVKGRSRPIKLLSLIDIIEGMSINECKNEKVARFDANCHDDGASRLRSWK
jgi:hypothetical protein